MIPTHDAARYMQRGALMVLLTAIVAVLTRLRLAVLLAACAGWALAVFLRVELEVLARRAWHRIACAWMQCDEAAP